MLTPVQSQTVNNPSILELKRLIDKLHPDANAMPQHGLWKNVQLAYVKLPDSEGAQYQIDFVIPRCGVLSSIDWEYNAHTLQIYRDALKWLNCHWIAVELPDDAPVFADVPRFELLFIRSRSFSPEAFFSNP